MSMKHHVIFTFYVFRKFFSKNWWSEKLTCCQPTRRSYLATGRVVGHFSCAARAVWGCGSCSAPFSTDFRASPADLSSLLLLWTAEWVHRLLWGSAKYEIYSNLVTIFWTMMTFGIAIRSFLLLWFKKVVFTWTSSRQALADNQASSCSSRRFEFSPSIEYPCTEHRKPYICYEIGQ